MNFDTYVVDTLGALQDLFAYAKQFNTPVVLDVETDHVQERLAKLHGIGLCFKDDEAFYIPIRKQDRSLCWSDAELNILSAGLHSLLKQLQWIGHNGLYDALTIEYNFGYDVSQLLHTDTILLKHTLDEERPFGLKEVAVKYLGPWADKAQDAMKESIKANGGSCTKENMEMYKADMDVLAEYCCFDVILTRKLYNLFLPMLKKEGLEKFFYEEEVMPLYREVTIDMKRQGIKIDVPYFEKLQKEVTEDMRTLEASIMDSIRDDVAEFEQKLLNKDYPISRKGMFPKLLADELGVVLPVGKTGTVTLSKAAVEKATKEAGDENSALFFEWLNGNDCMSSKLLRRVQFKRFQKDNERPHVFNLKSGDHLAHLIFEVHGEMPLGTTETGKPQVDDELLESLKDRYEWIAKLVEYKKLLKLSSTYIDGVLDRHVNSIIYTSFLQFGTTSGRYSCIAEGQMVSMPGGDKPIEQVKVGDYVYCYSDDGKPTISKVTKTFDNGLQDCIALDWRSQGSHKAGTLICTTDHRIKTRDNRWVEAGSLKKDDRVYHLRRAVAPANGRARIYGAGYFMENEEQMIKRSVFGAPSKWHAHHKNENKMDNRIENIEVLSPEEHTRQHSIELARSGRNKWEHLRNYRPEPKYGKDNPLWIPITRFQALRMLAEAKGRLTFVPYDFETFKRKCRSVNLDYEAVCQRYSSKGKYLNRRLILETSIKFKRVWDACKHIGVSLYKYRDLCFKFGVEYNHKIIGSHSVGKRRVYDLEVEKYHNFIASEICVHNCSNPNLQNIPSTKEDNGGLTPLVLKYTNSIRAGFISREGKRFVDADQIALEPKCFAHMSNSPDLKAIFLRGEDMYSSIAIKTFKEKGLSPFKKDSNYLGKVKPELRKLSKVFCLATVYGAEAGRISDLMGNTREEAQDIINAYLDAYPELKTYINESHESAKKLGYVQTIFGRKRHLPEVKALYEKYGDKLLDYRFVNRNGLKDQRRAYKNGLNNATNMRIQGLGAHIINRAAIRMRREFIKSNLEAHIIMNIHDQLVIECNENIADKVKKIVQDCMENTVTISVPLVAEPQIANNLKDSH